MMPSIMSGSLIRDTPPWARMSAGTRSSAITATAPASSAIFACSAVTTSMITPPLSISAMPRLTRGGAGAGRSAGVSEVCSAMPPSVRRGAGRAASGRAAGLGRRATSAYACRRTTQIRWTTVTVLAAASAQSVTYSRIGRSKMPVSPVITRIATSRSARSAMPTLAWKPSPSALARA